MKARVLVIDDEAAIRESMRMILDYEGHETLTAGSGQEGRSVQALRGRDADRRRAVREVWIRHTHGQGDANPIVCAVAGQ